MLGFQVIAISGFAMLAGTARPRVQYAGTILAAIGEFVQFHPSFVLLYRIDLY